MPQDLMQKMTEISPVQVGKDTYLSYDAVLTEVANHLFPDGPQSEVDFQQVIDQAKSMLIQLGFGSPVILNPRLSSSTKEELTIAKCHS